MAAAGRPLQGLLAPAARLARAGAPGTPAAAVTAAAGTVTEPLVALPLRLISTRVEMRAARGTATGAGMAAGGAGERAAPVASVHGIREAMHSVSVSVSDSVSANAPLSSGRASDGSCRVPLSESKDTIPVPLLVSHSPGLRNTLRQPSYPGPPAGQWQTAGPLPWQLSPLHAPHGAGFQLRGISGSSLMARAPASPEASASSRDAAAPLGESVGGGGAGEGQAAHPGLAPGVRMLGGLPPTKAGEKPRVVVLGSGWAACRFLKEIDTKAFDVVSVSPRNHMVFTPLLASTCVGTLEFRSVAEPVEVIQPAVSREPNSHFFLANCVAVHPATREIECEAVSSEDSSRPQEGGEKWRFSVAYDKLVIAVGAEAATFGIQGVHQNALFLREVQHAQHIRRRLLNNLMKCETPGLSDTEKRQILSCVVVGGGPTGVEFSGELGDFIRKDVSEKYAHVKDYISITLVEASEILSSFDVGLREYAVNQLTKAGVSLVKGQVREVLGKSIVLTDGTQVPYGLLVWSTGVGPTPFVRELPLPKAPGGRIAVDERLGVVGHADIFALGDCAGYDVSTGKTVLPALAQVAERQGRYLAHRFNFLQKKHHWVRPGGQDSSPAGASKVHAEGEEGATGAGGRPGAGSEAGEQPASAESIQEPGMSALLDPADKPFVYRHLGSMATIGRYSALVDLRENKSAPGISLKGFFSFLVWRSAYLTRLISWRNRLYVMVNWATTMLFGRDVSKI